MTPVAAHQDEKVLLIRANAHLFSRSDVLADFEIETIKEMHDRVVQCGGAAMTRAERAVVETALEAMVLAPRQDLTDKELAA